MKIILVRHTESIANVKSFYSGRNEIELSEFGLKQLDIISEKVREYNIKKIYTSPLNRCVKLAQKISNEITIDKNIIEYNFGVFEGLTKKEIKSRYPKEYKLWNDDYVNYKVPDGDNLKICYERSSKFLENIKSKNEDVIIVTHGAIIKLMIINLLNLNFEYYSRFLVDNGCIIEIEYKENIGIFKNLINFKKE